jgi:hypothetical protein
METGNTIIIITLIMMAYVLLESIANGACRPVSWVSPPARPGNAPNILTAFILLIVPLILAALVGAVDRQYIAWRVGAFTSDVRRIAC